MPVMFMRGDMFATSDINIIAHGVNLQGAFAAGVAGEIARWFPWAKEDYLRWLESKPQLGDVRLSIPPEALETSPTGTPFGRMAPGRIFIAHLATQRYPGKDARLSAVRLAVAALRGVAPGGTVIAIPRIGCGIGGLDWLDVKPILEEKFASWPVILLVFEEFVKGLPGMEIR